MTTTAIDLSQLPFPGVVEVIDSTTLYAERKAGLIALSPADQQADIAAALELDSEPMAMLLQESAYREMGVLQRVNDAARAVMLVYAQKNDLDQVAARVNVQRLVITPADEENGIAVVMESDTDLRRRALLAPLGYSVAGPAGAYLFHALTADSAVLDAAAHSPAPGEVLVTVLSRNGTGTAPAELLAKVDAALTAETVRPLTDLVTVQSASIVPYRIEAKLFMFPGPDASIAVAEARARLDAYVTACRGIRRVVALSGIDGALHVSGVERIQLIEPADDVITAATEAPHCVEIVLTLG
jgi:phage-related baseplate assembly protein